LLTKKDGFYLYASFNPPSLVSFNPDSANAGTSISLNIRGLNSHFTKFNPGGEIWLAMDSSTISDTSVLIFSDTFMAASFKIPANAKGGYWTLHLKSDLDGDISKDSFRIIGLFTGIYTLERQANNGLTMYPNPSSGILHYHINLDQAGLVKAEILDLNGRKI